MGLNLRLIGEHAAAIATLERAQAMFLQVEGAASAEAQWCEINRAAAAAMRAGSPAALQALIVAGERYLGSDNSTFVRVVHLLLAETAADFGAAPMARRHLEAAAAVEGAGDGMRARIQGVRLQLDWIAGRAVSSDDLALIDAPGAMDTSGITRARLLRIAAGKLETAAACARAQAAWAVVDPAQVAWNAEQRALAGCP